MTTNGRDAFRTFSDLAAHWNTNCLATPWRTSRAGNPTRRLAGGVSVAIDFDQRTSRYAVRFCGGRGGRWRETFATLRAAMLAVDAIEAHR